VRIHIERARDGSPNGLVVTRQEGDPEYPTNENVGWGSGESRLFTAIKVVLNRKRDPAHQPVPGKGWNLEKRPMWQDGHLVDEHRFSLRSCNLVPGQPVYLITDPDYAYRLLNEDFNAGKPVRLLVEDIGVYGKESL